MVSDALVAAKRFAVTSTPTMVINGWRYEGTPSRKLLTEIVEALLAGELVPGPPVS